MKYAFVTCVQLGYSCLESIYQIGGEMELLITLHDHICRDKSGRIYLDEFANKHDVELLKIKNVNEDNVKQKLLEKEIDYLFIIGWSQIAKKDILDIPKLGVIGMHPTLLPIGRGRAAIPWAIIKNLEKTGVSMFLLDEGVDTGDIIGQIEIPISKYENATCLYDKVNKAHVNLIQSVFPLLERDSIKIKKQDDSKATIWPGRTPADGEIKEQMSVYYIEKIVRATTKPYPGAFYLKNGKKIVIWSGKIVKNQEDINEFTIEFSDGQYTPIDFEVVT